MKDEEYIQGQFEFSTGYCHNHDRTRRHSCIQIFKGGHLLGRLHYHFAAKQIVLDPAEIALTKETMSFISQLHMWTLTLFRRNFRHGQSIKKRRLTKRD